MQDHRAELHLLDRPELLPRRTKQNQFCRATPNVHGDSTASARSHDHIGMVLVELLLGDADGQSEILVGQLRIDDLVAVLRQEGRFDAAWDRLPAVKEEDFHGGHCILPPASRKFWIYFHRRLWLDPIRCL